MMWQDRAACRDSDPRVFFPDVVGAERNALVREARAICEQCPVAQECHEFAQSSNDGRREQYGVWAGVNYSPKYRPQAELPAWRKTRTLVCEVCSRPWRWAPAAGCKPPQACSASCKNALLRRLAVERWKATG